MFRPAEHLRCVSLNDCLYFLPDVSGRNAAVFIGVLRRKRANEADGLFAGSAEVLNDYGSDVVHRIPSPLAFLGFASGEPVDLCPRNLFGAVGGEWGDTRNVEVELFISDGDDNVNAVFLMWVCGRKLLFF